MWGNGCLCLKFAGIKKTFKHSMRACWLSDINTSVGRETQLIQSGQLSVLCCPQML